MCKFYTVAMFCACGGQSIEIDVTRDKLDSKIRAWRSWHQGRGCGPMSEEEVAKRYNAWYEDWWARKGEGA